MDRTDVQEKIETFSKDPYFQVATKTAENLLEQRTERSTKDFGMTLGALLVNAPVKELKEVLPEAQEIYANHENHKLRYLSKTCERAEDELANVMCIGDGSIKDTAVAMENLNDMLCEINRAEERLDTLADDFKF